MLVQEYLEGGDLFDYMENSGMAAGPESQVKRWFAQLADAVAFMHDVAGVVHRDIKPENVVLTASLRDVRLLDFGLSRTTDPITRPLVRGRAGCVAPGQSKVVRNVVVDLSPLSCAGRIHTWRRRCL